MHSDSGPIPLGVADAIDAICKAEGKHNFIGNLINYRLDCCRDGSDLPYHSADR